MERGSIPRHGATPCGGIGRHFGSVLELEYRTDLKSVAERIEGSSPSTPTIYGPYLREDGRKFLRIRLADGKVTTKMYARWLMEKFLGRELSVHETVDHIDDNKSNDSLENLQVISRANNARKAMDIRPKRWYEFSCPVCGAHAKKEMRYVEGNWKKGRSGPFCSRVCAGKGSQ